MAVSREVQCPFDAMREARVLSPLDVDLNEKRWLAGAALRLAHRRGWQSITGVVDFNDPLACEAREKICLCAREVGDAAWPVVVRVVLADSDLADCLHFVSDVLMPAGRVSVVMDRLRVALDRIAPIVGVG